MTYPIVDISEWKFMNLNVSGSKEKRWYESETTNKLALFKLPISFRSETLREPTGESWSEKVSSEIGKAIGFKTHKTDIATMKLTHDVMDFYGINPEFAKHFKEIHGSLCWSFLNENESLVEGADMIMGYDQTYDRDFLQGDKEIYNFDLLYRVFRDYEMLDDLFQMIVFDTLIGNTDRHQDNFGIIRNENTGKIIRFAPLYDNASSLGRELSRENAEKKLSDDRSFNAYLFGTKSTTLIRWNSRWEKKEINIFDFYNLVKEKYYNEIIKHNQVVENLSDKKIYNIVNNVPSIVMSDVHKELAIKILFNRRDYLLRKEH